MEGKRGAESQGMRYLGSESRVTILSVVVRSAMQWGRRKKCFVCVFCLWFLLFKRCYDFRMGFRDGSINSFIRYRMPGWRCLVQGTAVAIPLSFSEFSFSKRCLLAAIAITRKLAPPGWVYLYSVSLKLIIHGWTTQKWPRAFWFCCLPCVRPHTKWWMSL